MNKTKFIEELSKKIECDLEYTRKVNDCLEENFIVGKKNKEKTISTLIQRLNLSEKEADDIYNKAMELITEEIKNKIKHPFKDLD